MFERVHGRAPVRVRVRFRSASSLLVAYSLNLSRGGMFIETATGPEVGTPLELELEAASSQPITVRGRVTWRRAAADGGGPPGVGVEFDDLSDQLGGAIDQLVSKFTGVGILLFCPDARERDTLRRMLRSVVAAAEVVSAESAALCAKLCDEGIDLVLVEADEDPDGALQVIACARGLASPIPVVALTADASLGDRLDAAGVSDRLGSPPALADLSRAVVRALGRPTSIG